MGRAVQPLASIGTHHEHLRIPQIRTVHLARHRFLPRDGGGTVYCTMTFRGQGSALALLAPGEFPEFVGEAGWFRVRWYSKRRRDFLEQIEGPAPCAIEKRP